MINMIQSFFSSLRTAFFFLVLLAVFFALGSYFANAQDIKVLFKQMTSVHIWSCLDSIVHNRTLLFWLLGLVICAIMLFLNTLFCTIKQLRQCWGGDASVKRTKQQFRLKIMAFIHIIALAVIGCHGLDIALVERHPPVKILNSETLGLGTYLLKVKEVSYITDRKYIQEDEKGRRPPSFKIPRKQFSIEGNKAELAVYKNGELVREGEIRLFEPLRVGGTFFILDGFFIPHGSDTLGLLIHRSYNPLALPFFGIYVILFFTLLLQCIKNRYRPFVKNPESLSIRN